MKLSRARLSLFFLWLGLFIFYVLIFLLTSFKDGVAFEQAGEAAWKVAYVQLPILAAFASFWFVPKAGSASQPGPETEEFVDADRTKAMFAITLGLHFLVLVYIVLAVVLPDFGYLDRPLSYDDRVNGGIKLLVFLSSVAVLPVGFVLKGQEVEVRPPPASP